MRTRYFFMDADSALPDMIGLRDFDIHGQRQLFTAADSEKMNDITVLYLDETAGECAPDLIRSPVCLISEMAAGVLDLYEDGLVWKKVVMIHKSEARQLVYYHLLLQELTVLHELTERYPNGMEKRLVLDREKTGHHKVFLLKDSMVKMPVVSLEVVESLLRRHVTGVTFREIEVA